MKKLNITIASLIALSSLVSCEDDLFIKGEGEVIQVEHTINHIDEVEVQDDIKVFIEQSEVGTPTTMRLVGQQNIIDNLEMRIDDGDLELKYDKNVKESAGLEVYITTPTMEELSASGASTIEIIGTLNTSELDASASGAAQISLDGLTTSNDVEVSLSGGSIFSVEEGTAKSLVFSMSGDSKLSAPDFIVKDIVAEQSGGSESAVHATSTIVAKLSGGSKLYYNGNPSISEHTTGGSEVLPLKK